MPASADASTGLSPFVETQPEVLSGPLPRYPDLLRQAGIEGRVVLEAIVDATGRVEAGSVVVAEATNPAFVGVARAALLATLFRPGAVNGRPVRVKVRIPYEFTLRNGTGRAR
jgi:protein TonB